MNIIGLCGGSGSGKSLVASYFSNLGIPTLDADQIYRELTLPGSDLLMKLSNTFGDEILREDGTFDRKRLASIVFSEGGRANLLPLLNKITHGAIIDETEKRIEHLKSQGFNTVIFDAPQLFESGFNLKCNKIIAVSAPENIRIKRVILRDGISQSAAKDRISSQYSDDFLKNNSDYFIINDTTVDEFYKKLGVIAEEILED